MTFFGDGGENSSLGSQERLIDGIVGGGDASALALVEVGNAEGAFRGCHQSSMLANEMDRIGVPGHG